MPRQMITLLFLLGCAGLAAERPALALECSDFPVGDRINSYSAGHQTHLGLAMGPGLTLHAVWSDRRIPVAPVVYYARSENRGVTFGAGIEVAPGSGLRVAGFPVVGAGPGHEVT